MTSTRPQEAQVFRIPDAVLAQHTAILGKTGSGKTTTGKVCVEQVVDEDYRVCIIDPVKSDWWGLTSSADGKRAGLPFTILGGPHGHVPLHHTSGKAIADVVGNGSLRLSILDMANFPPGGAQHFFVDFIPRLMQKMKGVLYLVIEEAHEFAPKERAGFGKENMSIHYAKSVATGGRSKGIRLIVLDQRVQALHNAVLGSCETVVVHRMTQPADQEPVVKWMKANVKDKDLRSQITDSMSKLKTGTGWLCSGEADLFTLMEFPKARTFDNSKTPGKDDDIVQVKTAQVDVESLRGIIGEAVKEAEANDPALLRAKIAELERQVGAGRTDSPYALEVERQRDIAIQERDCARQDAIRPADACPIDHDALGWHSREQGYQQGVQAAQAAATDSHEAYMERIYGKIRDAIADVVATRAPFVLPQVEPLKGDPKDGVSLGGQNFMVKVRPLPRPASAAIHAPAAAPKDAVSSTAINVLGEAEIKFLNVLEGRRGLGKPTSRDQLALFAMYSATSRHVDNTLGTLRSAGYAEGPGSDIRITHAGVQALVSAKQRRVMPTGARLREAWLTKSGKAEAGFLTFLIHKYPRTVTRDELAVATGYSPASRHVDNTLGRLRALGLIVGPGSRIAASGDLFDGTT